MGWSKERIYLITGKGSDFTSKKKTLISGLDQDADLQEQRLKRMYILTLLQERDGNSKKPREYGALILKCTLIRKRIVPVIPDDDVI